MDLASDPLKKMVKVWLISASVFGFLSVGFGAFGAHSLNTLNVEQMAEVVKGLHCTLLEI